MNENLGPKYEPIYQALNNIGYLYLYVDLFEKQAPPLMRGSLELINLCVSDLENLGDPSLGYVRSTDALDADRAPLLPQESIPLVRLGEINGSYLQDRYSLP